MSRARQHFRQSDLVKAIKAAAAAGLSVGRVEVSPDGRIIIVAGARRSARPRRSATGSLLNVAKLESQVAPMACARPARSGRRCTAQRRMN
jgi:hypothetical protein